MGSEIISNIKDNRFTAGPARFRILQGKDTQRTTTDDEIVILKCPEFLRKYDNILNSLPNNNVVEIGIAEGGSLIYFALAFPHLTFTGIDLRSPNEKVTDHIKKLGLSDRIKLHYRIDQADKRKVRETIAEDFKGAKIGAIIEDACHWYEQSRKTFEATFELLETDGVYCLEDWSWAHEAGRTQNGGMWWDKPSLSNLLFEIIMLQPSTSDLVRNIRVDQNVAVIERGTMPVKNLCLDDLIINRGKKLQLI